jgi:hypothetical protein
MAKIITTTENLVQGKQYLINDLHGKYAYWMDVTAVYTFAGFDYEHDGDVQLIDLRSKIGDALLDASFMGKDFELLEASENLELCD